MESIEMDLMNRVSSLVTSSALLWCVGVYADQHESHVIPEDRYDLRRLMQPSAAELAAEERGHIHIYDSLEYNEVEAALDQNFERIQNIMFTRIRHLPPTGAGPAEVEDDGCD